MDMLDKYKTIISMFEDMGICTSTDAMAPYPTGAVSVTTVTNAPRKDKSRRAMLNYKYTKQWGEKNSDIVEAMLEIANICEAIAQVAGKPFILGGKPTTPDEWRKFMRERKLTALKIAGDEGKKENKEIFEGRHISQINPKMYKKYKNMKYIDTDYYPDLSPEEIEKIKKTQKQQEKYQDLIGGAELEGDQAKQNILVGNLKRTQHRLQNLTRAQKAKIYKSMGKALNRQIRAGYEAEQNGDN